MTSKVLQDVIDNYANAIAVVEKIGDIFERAMASAGKKFSAEIFDKQFDCIMQYSMLQLAVADGKISADEVAIIKNITDHGDLVDYINSFYKVDISWEDILNAANQSVEKWIKGNESLVDKIADEFITVFAAVDKADKSRDMFEELATYWSRLLGSIAIADDEATEEEREAFKRCYLMKVASKISDSING